MDSKNTYYAFFSRLRRKIIPRSIDIRVNPEAFSILEFVKFASKNVKRRKIVLDAGAGSCPYERYFQHTRYESTDMGYQFKKQVRKHDFLCSLDNIPKPDNSYDAIINTQVLEYIKYPKKVIDEFYRILKPGGKLFLSAPQEWHTCTAPISYYNFTNFGLRMLFEDAGFDVISIKPRGGVFWSLSTRTNMVPYILLQRLNSMMGKKRILGALLLLPLYAVLVPFCTLIIPLMFFYLDRVDREKYWTLGYACYCKKPVKAKKKGFKNGKIRVM